MPSTSAPSQRTVEPSYVPSSLTFVPSSKAPTTGPSRTYLFPALFLPINSSIGSSGLGLPSVALVTADRAAHVDDVQSKLSATGLFTTVDILGCAQNDDSVQCANTPSLAQLQQYSAVLAWTWDWFYDPPSVGNALASYVDGGGQVVMCALAFENGQSLYGTISGRFQSGNYNALTYGVSQQGHSALNTASMVTYSPLLAGVSSFDGGTFSGRVKSSLSPNAACVAFWTTGECLMAYRIDGTKIVTLNVYPASGDSCGPGSCWLTNTDGTRLITNALLFGDFSK